MSVLKLKPCCKDYIWGGRRLAEEYGIASDKDILAEAWVLSCHPDGPSVIVNGPDQGKTLAQYIQETGAQALGTHCRRFRDFPILVKFIDAKQNLSVQVHPGNRYALAEEHQYGKTEMWYVMDAGPNAFLYYGFKREVSKEEFARRYQSLGLEPKDSEEELLGCFLEAVQSKGPRVVVVTRGSKGSLAWDGKQRYCYGIAKCEVVDTMGAGDSFIAGFLYGILQGRSIPEAMEAGAENSAVTLGYSGAW